MTAMCPHYTAIPDQENKLNIPFLKADIDGNSHVTMVVISFLTIKNLLC